jgi:hypothetical protein
MVFLTSFFSHLASYYCLFVPEPLYIFSSSTSSILTSSLPNDTTISSSLPTRLPNMAPRKPANKSSDTPNAPPKASDARVVKRKYKKVRLIENGLIDVERKAGKFLKM